MVSARRSVYLAAVLMAASAVAASPVAASSVGADSASGPVAQAAHYPQTAKVTVPALGNALVESSTLPANTTRATIDIQGLNANNLNAFTAVVVSNYPKLGKLSKRGQGVLTCVILSEAVTSQLDIGLNYVDSNPAVQLMFLSECLHVVLQLTRAPAADAANSAAAMCFRMTKAIGIQVTHPHSTYRGVVNGRTHKPSGRSPLAVSCRPRGSGIRLTLRPSVHGRTLRQVAGPNLSIGLANRGTKPVGISTTFAVR